MRICKNKITDSIRQMFNANPLRVPEARIRPLCLLEIKDERAQFLGDFKYLVKGGFNHDLDMQDDMVAEVSDQKTKKFDFNLALGILGNFIKAFGSDPAKVSAGLKTTKKLAFSFANVRRHYFAPLQLGSILSSNDVLGDPDNIFIKEIINNKKLKLALVTDVLTSNNFSMSSHTDKDASADIDVPLIQEAVSDIDVGIKVEKVSDNEIKFVNDKALTFAFSCVEINIDPNTGKFSRGAWINNIKGAKRDLSEAEENHLSKWALDKKLARPLMWEMD